MEASGIPLLTEYKGHQSLRERLIQGYQVVSFCPTNARCGGSSTCSGPLIIDNAEEQHSAPAMPTRSSNFETGSSTEHR